MQRIREQGGMALLSVLVVILVLTLLGGLVLYLSGQEMHLTTVRYRAAQSLNIAEGGAFKARAALMAAVNADPTDAAQFTGDMGTVAVDWWAGGVAGVQKPLAFLGHVRVDGAPLASGTDTVDWVVFAVNWSLPSQLRKMEYVAGGTGPPPTDPMSLTPVMNALGDGSYRAVVVVSRRAEAHDSCYPQGSACFVHFVQPATVLIPLSYQVIADGQVDPQFRRRVTLQGDFKVVLGNTSFAQWLSFSHVFTLSGGTNVYFFVTESYDGPIHTNGRFRFWGFPKFGTPDFSAGCPAGIRATRLTSTDTRAAFRRLPGNPGSPVVVTLEADEWVGPDGQRIAAPVLPDCTPMNFADDFRNPIAQFNERVRRGPDHVRHPADHGPFEPARKDT